MRVVFVVDTVQPTNGVATSAQRAAATLRGRGHEVVVVATDGSVRRPHRGWIDAAAPSEVDRYVAQPWHIPVVSLFAQAQRFTFATPSRELLERAYRGADVVHIWLATPMGRMALQVAQKMGIPVSAGFHVQPENITYNIGLGRFRSTTSAVYTALREYFYEEIGHIHCPSQFIADQLADHGYRARTHVISNGVTDVFTPGEPRPVWTLDSDRPLRIMSVGRLSPEKRHELLIDAVKHSRYRDRLDLQIAGKGPRRTILQAHGVGLAHPLRLTYHSQERLVDELRAADLYVHPADAEIEAVACLEAVACGLVPVIARSPRSAASQFALDPRSLFPTNDRDALTRRLDWWIEHPQERARMGARYAKSARQYSIHRSGQLLEQMFQQTITDARTGR